MPKTQSFQVPNHPLYGLVKPSKYKIWKRASVVIPGVRSCWHKRLGLVYETIMFVNDGSVYVSKS